MKTGIIKASPTDCINILLYHQIGDIPGAATNLDCFCKISEFYIQMDFLKNSDYHVISLKQAVDLIFNRRNIDGKYVVLTFDDGCESFYNITYPILERLEFPSTIYPVAGYLGRYASWKTLNNRDLKIVSKKMVIELNKLGVEIGAHTMDHVKLAQVERANAIRQIQESKEILEQLLGQNICSFSYPHGQFNANIIKIVNEVGFENALTCISNSAEEANSIFEIPRKYITFDDDLEKFKQKLS
jgi:peptidoglycan/xylan/chitin deacetylase (PgdA/CDA1 family)